MRASLPSLHSFAALSSFAALATLVLVAPCAISAASAPPSLNAPVHHSAAVKTMHRAGLQRASEAYYFVPGLGTAVVTVAPDGKASIAAATLHVATLGFTVNAHPDFLSAVRFRGNKPRVAAGRSLRPSRLRSI